MIFKEEELSEDIDVSAFSGILRRDASDKGRNCWMVPEPNLFKVRSINFPYDKSKVVQSPHSTSFLYYVNLSLFLSFIFLSSYLFIYLSYFFNESLTFRMVKCYKYLKKLKKI